MNQYYAVKRGRQPGIYSTWPKTQQQVNGYSGAQYKSFSTKADAVEYLKGQSIEPDVLSTDEVVVFTDGGSRNTGNRKNDHVHQEDKAAWAYLILTNNQKIKGTAGAWGATNNQMEITALLEALQWLIEQKLTDCSIKVVSDSHYVLDAITKGWLNNWQRRQWRTSNGQEVKNQALWKKMISLLAQFKNLNFEWTKGHATNHGNVFVDQLLNQTMDQMHPEQTLQPQLTKTNFKAPTSARPDSLAPANDDSVDALTKSLNKLGFDVNIKRKRKD